MYRVDVPHPVIECIEIACHINPVVALRAENASLIVDFACKWITGDDMVSHFRAKPIERYSQRDEFLKSFVAKILILGAVRPSSEPMTTGDPSRDILAPAVQ
jgi:hypothetical protein